MFKVIDLSTGLSILDSPVYMPWYTTDLANMDVSWDEIGKIQYKFANKQTKEIIIMLFAALIKNLSLNNDRYAERKITKKYNNPNNAGFTPTIPANSQVR